MTNIIKTALVTGASKRIGRQISLDLARDGWAVAVHYAKSQTAAGEVVAEILKNGGKAISVGGDLSDAKTPQKIIKSCVDALGPLTLLVNNASRFEA